MFPTGQKILAQYDIFHRLGTLAMSTPVLFPCAICNQPVSLGDAKADDKGRTVHEDCYLRQLIAAEESKARLHAN